MKLFRYIRQAFLNRWNLLGLAGGLGFAVLSGHPGIGLPLLAAAELAWLGFVGTHPAFQRHVELTENSSRNAEKSGVAVQRMRKMLAALPRGGQVRYEELKKQCQELQSISQQFQSANGKSESYEMTAAVQNGGLDHLMWLFLKLLYTEHTLNRFFETTTIEQIQRNLKDVTGRLEREHERPAGPQRERIIATLEDNRATCQQRLQNFQQARDSFELVKAEQQRLESRIRSIAEMGISRGDPTLLSTQVDSVAGSIAQTERALDDLRFITGFSEEDEFVPEILPRLTDVH